MPLEPENGLVIRYDFLWKREHRRGQEQGAKDRPCAIVLASEPQEDGNRQVVVCPITHSEPDDASSALEVPAKVAAHLKLDEERSWIVTDQVNVFTWERGRIPFGVSPAKRESWAYGHIPPKLYKRMRDQVLAHRKRRALRAVRRDRKAPHSES